MKDKEQWMIWFVPYQTYEEELLHGSKAPHIVAGPFGISEALNKVELLGFGYCVKPI